MWRAMISQLLIQLPVYLLLLLLSVLKIEFAHADEPILAKPGCNDTCGGVIIPFPFGIGPNCSLDHWFEIECKPPPHSNGSTKPFLSKFSTEVMEISLPPPWPSTVKVRMPPLNSCNADTNQQPAGIDLRSSPYYYSTDDNVFVMEGCPQSAVLYSQSNKIMAGCGTICHSDNRAIPSSNCYGVHCCQTPLPYLPDFYKIYFSGNTSSEHQNCSVATVLESESMNHYYKGMLSNSNHPVVLLWTWPSDLQPDYNPRAHCEGSIYDELRCYCKGGYYGNPYLPNGCQVPQECKDCRGYCSGDWNLRGHLITLESYICEKKPLLQRAATLGLSISFGTILLVIGIVYGFYRSTREIRQRAKFFERNGGLLLQQQLSSIEGVVKRTRIFSMSELDKATDHFNENRILGQGGQGTVYKGMLNDGGIVAIKKATLLDESQLEQFINEVVILSQINHRNVVKLMGCCLEMEIPLLVYEFIPNGSLYQYIHDPDEDFAISWEMRLSIAADSARAIAYLHSSSSVPVYHRDIKSSNILLDGKHRAKVSDFGCSKTVAIDQTHLTTVVKGTWGYLDPEYFHTHQFTEKSDVYSFGVVLLELLTSKKPIYKAKRTMEPKNLASQFLFLMKNSGLSHILDHKIVEAAKEQELMVVVELAKRCLSGIGRMRPTMREVATTLETLTKSPNKVPTSYEQGFSDDKFGESFMSETDADFMSNPLPADSVNSMYIDLSPPQPETI